MLYTHSIPETVNAHRVIDSLHGQIDNFLSFMLAIHQIDTLQFCFETAI